MPLESSWLVIPRPRPLARARVLCIPHAGSGPSAYRSWARHLAPELELLVVAPPGREHRAHQEPVRTLQAYLDPLTAELLAHPGLPLALFGHSMGAVIAHQLALRLLDAGRPPLHLFLSGRGFPSDLPATQPMFALSDSDLLAQVRRTYGGFPEEMEEYPELLAEALCQLRADLELLERLVPRTRPVLDLPVTVFWGEEDASLSRESLRRWQEITTRPLDSRALAGGHFSVLERAEEVARHVSRATSEELGRAVSPGSGSVCQGPD